MKYIGETRTVLYLAIAGSGGQAAPIGQPLQMPTEQLEFELTNGTEYAAQTVNDGPQMFVNGQPVIHPDSTIWVIIEKGPVLPYAPDLIKKQWEI